LQAGYVSNNIRMVFFDDCEQVNLSPCFILKTPQSFTERDIVMSDIKNQKVTRFPRLMASIFYDSLLLTAVLFFATFVLLLIPEEIRNTSPIVQASKVFWYLLVSYIYFVGFWIKGGQTPGMKAWKLVLVNMQGDPPGLKRATLRYFSAILSWALAGMGFLWMLVDSNHYSLHDHLSGSKLIVKDS